MISYFHSLNADVGRPLGLNNPFRYQSHPLVLMVMKHVRGYIQSMQTRQEEVVERKMSGVLVVENQQ